MNLFESNDYKTFLNHKLASEGFSRAEIAKAAGCQRPYISQVLNGNPHITLDQSLAIAEFLELNNEETDYFFHLVALARAGTKSAKIFYEKKINEIKDKRNNLSSRLNINREANIDFPEYYSDHRYALIHMALTIRGIDTIKSLSSLLNLPEKIVTQYLIELEKVALVTKSKSKWRTTQKTIHLPNNHHMNFHNHRMWRQQAIDLAQIDQEDSLNYSSLCTLSKSDYFKIKEMALQFIESSREKIKVSREEQLCVLNIDLCKVDSSAKL